MRNYFYDLPIDIQEKIYFELHKIYMTKVKKKILGNVIWRVIRKHSDWLNYQNISPRFWSNNNLLMLENGLES